MFSPLQTCFDISPPLFCRKDENDASPRLPDPPAYTETSNIPSRPILFSSVSRSDPPPPPVAPQESSLKDKQSQPVPSPSSPPPATPHSPTRSARRRYSVG